MDDSYPILRQHPDEETAATTIQTRFRAHSARKQCRKKKVWADKERHRKTVRMQREREESGAATRLQTRYRGHLAQREVATRRRDRDLAQRQRSVEQRRKDARKREEADQIEAATKLQTSFRGKLARDRADGMKAERLRAEKARRRADFSRKKRRQHAEREKQQAAERQSAARRVQAAYRGKLARCMYKKALVELLMKNKSASRRAKSRAERRRRREEERGGNGAGVAGEEDDPATEERGANTECSMFRMRDAATSMNVDAATSTEPTTCEVATQYDAEDQEKAAVLTGGGKGFGGPGRNPADPFGDRGAVGASGAYGGFGGAASPSYLSSDSLASDDEELFSPVGRPSRESFRRRARSPHRRPPSTVHSPHRRQSTQRKNEMLHSAIQVLLSPGGGSRRRKPYEPAVHPRY